MSTPDWRLPAGVSRSLWEFSRDRQIARDEHRHLAGAALLEFDRQVVREWLPVPCRLVDLGCGTGRSIVEFAARGCECVGIDLSEESLAVAAERLSEAGLEARLIRANLCELGCLSGGQFDAALLLFGTLGMITGSENRRQVLVEARRLLRPGGRLALHVHNVWRHFFSPPGRRWLARDFCKRLAGDPTAGDTEHAYRGIPRMFHHAFTLGEIRRLLRSCGLTIREVLPLAAIGPSDGPETGVATSAVGVPDLVCRGAFPNVRATGWLILAES
jgi:ubiquinone/menaquinone biosynthesis C-methylase UbiE